MAPPISRYMSARLTSLTRDKNGYSENFPCKNPILNPAFYSKRKAEHSPPKTKSTKRPALNDLTNDVSRLDQKTFFFSPPV